MRTSELTFVANSCFMEGCLQFRTIESASTATLTNLHSHQSHENEMHALHQRHRTTVAAGAVMSSHPVIPVFRTSIALLGVRVTRPFAHIWGPKHLGCDSPAYTPQTAVLILHHSPVMIVRVALMLGGTGGKLRHSGKPRYSNAKSPPPLQYRS